MKRFMPLLLLAVIGAVYLGYQRYLSGRPFEWSGTIEVRAVTVGSRTGGRVKTVLVREGDRVEPGAPLVLLEPGDLDAQRAIAQAQLDIAQASLDKLTKGARSEEIAQAKARAAQAQAALAEVRRGSRAEEIAVATARLAQTQATVDKATLDAERARQLLAVGAIPKADAEQAETLLKTATAQRDAQRDLLAQIRAGARVEEKAQVAARAAEADAAMQLVLAGARSEDVRAAEAQVAAAKGRVDQLDVLIRELTVRAPVGSAKTASPGGTSPGGTSPGGTSPGGTSPQAAKSLRVETLDLRPGDLVAPNAPVATLLEDGQLFVRIYVPETQIGHVKVGDTVPIKVDSFDHTFDGKIEHINVRGEFSPRNLQTADERADQVFAVRVSTEATELRAGMAASIEVPK